jgi:transcription termination/antitermination protein NusA
MTILFNDNLVTYEEALSTGVKGMVELAGIGPKKAEALIELAENIKERIKVEILETAAREEEKRAFKEASNTADEEQKTIDAPKKSTSRREADLPEDDDDEEILIQNLSGVSQELLNLLETNGFETLAELSITKLDELVAIDGIDEESGKNILKKVNQQLGNVENV